MENNAGSKDKPLSSEEDAAKAAILAECDKLANAGVTFVAAHFDGYGDDGATEEVRCFNSQYYAYEEHDAVDYDALHLQEHFEVLVPLATRTTAAGLGMLSSM